MLFQSIDFEKSSSLLIRNLIFCTLGFLTVFFNTSIIILPCTFLMLLMSFQILKNYDKLSRDEKKIFDDQKPTKMDYLGAFYTIFLHIFPISILSKFKNSIIGVLQNLNMRPILEIKISIGLLLLTTFLSGSAIAYYTRSPKKHSKNINFFTDIQLISTIIFLFSLFYIPICLELSFFTSIFIIIPYLFGILFQQIKRKYLHAIVYILFSLVLMYIFVENKDLTKFIVRNNVPIQ